MCRGYLLTVSKLFLFFMYASFDISAHCDGCCSLQQCHPPRHALAAKNTAITSCAKQGLFLAAQAAWVYSINYENVAKSCI